MLQEWKYAKDKFDEKCIQCVYENILVIGSWFLHKHHKSETIYMSSE